MSSENGHLLNSSHSHPGSGVTDGLSVGIEVGAQVNGSAHGGNSS